MLSLWFGWLGYLRDDGFEWFGFVNVFLVGINATTLRLFMIREMLSEIISNLFKLANMEIHQTVSVKSLEVPTKKLFNSFSFSHLFVSKYKINLPSIEEIRAFIEDELDSYQVNYSREE